MRLNIGRSRSMPTPPRRRSGNQAVERPHDPHVLSPVVARRARMALAALKAGMAFSNTRTALAHSISYEMTLRFGLPHGIACSFPLPMVLERALGRRERDAVLALALGAAARCAGAPGRLHRRARGETRPHGGPRAVGCARPNFISERTQEAA